MKQILTLAAGADLASEVNYSHPSCEVSECNKWVGFFTK